MAHEVGEEPGAEGTGEQLAAAGDEQQQRRRRQEEGVPVAEDTTTAAVAGLPAPIRRSPRRLQRPMMTMMTRHACARLWR